MQRIINNVISVSYTFLKFSLMKIIMGKRFNFSLIQRFSPNTHVNFLGKNSTITLGNKVKAHTGVRMKAIGNGKIIIGDETGFNFGCMLFAMEEINIGKDVQFGPNVLLYDNDHDFRAEGGVKANKFKISKIEIGDYTWIGANTMILRGTKIGKNCVVGAGCVLNGTYPDNSIIVQKRDTQVIDYKPN